MSQQHSVKRFSVIFLSVLYLALLGFAWMTSSRADTPTSSLSTDSDGTYLIATSKDLASFRDLVNGGSYDISAKLTADVDLAGGETNQWAPIGNGNPYYFNGTFDGQGHAITGLYISTDEGAGLFGQLSSGAKVCNLSVSGDVAASRFVGLVAYTNDGGSIYNCTVTGTAKCTGSNETWGGGVVGGNFGTIANCSANATISGTIAGTIVGVNLYGNIVNCSTSGSVTGSDTAGGIVGNNKGSSVQNCFANVKIRGADCGGITGQNINHSYADSVVTHCAASCDVFGTANAGGIVGTNCREDSDTSHTVAKIIDCAACGTISGDNNTGGITGNNDPSRIISNCGWLDTSAVNGIGSGSGSDRVASFTSADVAAGRIVTTCLPDKVLLSVLNSTSSDVNLVTYPSTNTDAARLSAFTAAISPDAIADAAISGKKVTVASKKHGFGKLDYTLTLKTTILSNDFSGSSDVALENLSTALSVNDAAPVISMDSALPDGAQNEAYPAYTLTLSGGTRVQWSVSGLPSGLVFSGDAISGTPTVYGDFKVIVSVSNSAGSDSKTLTLKVTKQVFAPAITTSTLSNAIATAGKPYQVQLKADGTSPAWSVVGGSLPDGITLTEGGLLSGTPTTAGTYTFTVQAKNSKGTATQELTITVVELNSSGSGGGCNAGFAVLALLGLPFVMRKKK